MESALEAADGIARRGLVLQTLMRLKQICNHPSQLLGDGNYQSAASGKFIRLSEICDELAERQDKVLIFTQFREIIEPIADHLAGVFRQAGARLARRDKVKMRKGIVEQFQGDNGPPFFILSLKAGGTGLNLTAASHVIISTAGGTRRSRIRPPTGLFGSARSATCWCINSSPEARLRNGLTP